MELNMSELMTIACALVKYRTPHLGDKRTANRLFREIETKMAKERTKFLDDMEREDRARQKGRKKK